MKKITLFIVVVPLLASCKKTGTGNLVATNIITATINGKFSISR